MSIEVLASFDNILNRLGELCSKAPQWRPAEDAVPYLRRVINALAQTEDRFNENIIVALLGGTGVGKSSLVNAILGGEFAKASPQRPTTRRATLYCSKGYTASLIGLPENQVVVETCNSPILQKLMIVDCPDPDSSEEENLAILRSVLPHCDVIIHLTTQQKYKNYAIARELKSASIGSSMIWVQTHADKDEDIRPHWKEELSKEFDNVDNIFFVDSKDALKRQLAGEPPVGDFAKLLETLTTQLPKIGALGIRRYHFLDIAEDSLSGVLKTLESKKGHLDELESKIGKLRKTVVERLTEQRVKALQDDRHQWERRIRNETISQWGTTPLSLSLQIYGMIDRLLFSSLLFRARSVTQLAVLGAVEVARKTKSMLSESQSQTLLEGIPVNVLTTEEQEKNRVVFSDAIDSAGLPNDDLSQINTQFSLTAEQFLISSEAHLDDVVATVAKKNSRWYYRGFFEFLMLSWIILLAWLPCKNFFYDYLYKGIVSDISANRPVVEKVIENRSIDHVAINYRTSVLYPTYVYIVTAIWFIIGASAITIVFSRNGRSSVNNYLDELSKKWKDSFKADLILQDEQTIINKSHRFMSEIRQLIRDIHEDKQLLSVPELSRRKIV